MDALGRSLGMKTGPFGTPVANEHAAENHGAHKVPGRSGAMTRRSATLFARKLHMKNKVMAYNGSIQSMEGIPDDLKQIYRTVWEIKQRTIVDMAVERGAYIDQSQSLNIHMEQPTTTKLISLHFHAWTGGLKTGMYYLRSQAAADAIKFTVDTASLKSPTKSTDEELLAQMVENRENVW